MFPDTPDNQAKALSTCKACGVPIQWIETASGSRMPAETTELTIITATGRLAKGFTPHWISCPGANQFRR
jgi:hypothetical protein